MLNAGEVVVDSLLCFLHSASNDFSAEGLVDMAFAFFSHDMIKASKTTLAIILHKEDIKRRDPDKKKKDLLDVIDFMKAIIESKIKVRFVCDTYKGMPPVGLQFIAPMMANLSEEMAKLNDILPKILDIKSEVNNTADTMRQLRGDVIDIKHKFSSAVNGMQEAAKDADVDDLKLIDELRSFRKSLTYNQMNLDIETEDNSAHGSLVDATCGSVDFALPGSLHQSLVTENQNEINSVSDPSTGAISKTMNDEKKGPMQNQEGSSKGSYSMALKSPAKQRNEDSPEEKNADEWKIWHNNRKRRNQTLGPSGRRPPGSSGYRVTGARREGQSSFRGVRRVMDVFIGRVDKTATKEDISVYIKDVFNIDIVNIDILKIKTDIYNAFKVSVNMQDRDQLFNSELWPEGIIVNKYYRKSSES